MSHPQAGDELQVALQLLLDILTKGGRPTLPEALANNPDFQRLAVRLAEAYRPAPREDEQQAPSGGQRADMIHLLPNAAFVIDKAGKVVAWNPAIEEMTGISAREMVGKDNYEYALPFYGIRRPMLIDMVLHPQPEIEQSYQGLKRDGDTLIVEPHPTTVHGRELYLWTAATALYDSNGDIAGALELAQDLTVQEQMEAQLRQLSRAVEQSPASIVITTLAGEIEYVNPKFTTVTGYTLEEVQGKNPRILKSGDKSAEEYKQLWDTITAGQEWHGEFHNRKKSGDLYWELASISPITDASGRITHFVAVKEDITARKRAEERRATLYRAAQEINASLNPKQVYQAVQQAVEQVMPCDDFAIASYDDAHNQIVPVYMSELGTELCAAPYQADHGLAGYVVRTGQSVRLGNRAELEASGILAETYGEAERTILSILAVPMRLKGKTVGMLTAQSSAEQAYTADDQELLEMLAAQAVIAFENARLFEETNRRAEHLDLLNRIGTSVAAGLDMDRVLASLYQECRRLVEMDIFYIALYEAGTGQINFPLFRELDRDIHWEPLDIRRRPGLTGQVIRSGQTLYVPDTLDSGDPQTKPILRAGGHPTRAYVGVPLSLRNQVIGVISMQSYRPYAYTPEQIDLLETVATQAAIAIENARLYTESRHIQEAAEIARRAAERSRAEAEGANRAKSAFLANMSHELRTPLNAILGFTQLIANAPNLTPTQRENLDIVGRSGENLLALINDVLEMSTIENGRAELNIREFDLHRLLLGLTEMFRLRAASRGVQLVLEQDDQVPPLIRADETKLRQVLINLLGNAIKFTHRGRIILRVEPSTLAASTHIVQAFEPDEVGFENWASAQRAREQGKLLNLEFQVQDTGEGIAPDDRDVIFDPFVRTSNGAGMQQGTGLGLSISRQYVRLMGGELSVSSRLGLGSVFTFNLPVEPVTRSASRAMRVARQLVIGLEPGQCAHDGGPFRLLVVENVEASRKLLVGLLRSLGPGLEIREATNGQEALYSWQQWKPHLIWMDVRTAALDSYATIQQIKVLVKPELGERAPIIVALTTGTYEKDRAKILAEGCDDLVRKPFQESDICEMLSRHLHLRFMYKLGAPEAALPEAALAYGSTAESDAPRASASTAELLEAIQILPSDWLAGLHRATVEGDIGAMAILVEGIRGENATLSEQLLDLTYSFKHKQILQLIEQVQGQA